MESFTEEVISLGWIQWGAVLTGIAYVVLAASKNPWCWTWGALSSLLSAIVFFQSRLYSDTLLQLYYLLIAVYGWFSWREGKVAGETFIASSRPPLFHLAACLGSLLISFVVGSIWSYFDAALPYMDALLAALSILATWMTTRKIRESWIYWILIDASYTVLYVERGLILFAILYLVYTAIATHAYIQWRKSPANLRST